MNKVIYANVMGTGALSKNEKLFLNKTEKTSPADKFDMQPDPVNGLDGKDPNELPPTNKKELAEQMRGKSISTRKNLAEGYIQSKDQKTRTKSKTMQRKR